MTGQHRPASIQDCLPLNVYAMFLFTPLTSLASKHNYIDLLILNSIQLFIMAIYKTLDNIPD